MNKIIVLRHSNQLCGNMVAAIVHTNLHHTWVIPIYPGQYKAWKNCRKKPLSIGTMLLHIGFWQFGYHTLPEMRKFAPPKPAAVYNLSCMVSQQHQQKIPKTNSQCA